MKTAVCLGGNGFIGNAMARYLKEQGYWIRIVDIKENDFFENVADENLILDLRNLDNVKTALQSPNEEPISEVYSFQSLMGGALYVFTGENDADIIHDSALMHLHIADTAARNKVGKLFFSSSACCYPEKIQMGKRSDIPLKENTAWEYGKPDSVYGIEKLMAEQVYDAYRRNYGLNIRIGRFHNIFGEGCVFEGNKPKAPAALCFKVASCLDNGEIEVFGDGKQKRSFLYIGEAIIGITKLMQSDYQFPVNIGSEESITINDLAKMVIEISGKKLTIKHDLTKPQGVRGRNSDNTLCEKVLNWKPSKPLREGICQLYSWVDKQVNFK